MIDFAEKFSDLLVEGGPTRELKVIPGEQRGDDMTCPYRSYDNSDLSLFLQSQKIAEDGFIENYCFRENNKKRLKEIRANIDEWKKAFMDTFGPYLNMSYEEFIKKSLDEQYRIINKIKSENDIDKIVVRKKVEHK